MNQEMRRTYRYNWLRASNYGDHAAYGYDAYLPYLIRRYFDIQGIDLALIVRLGKEHCRKSSPVCEGCPLEFDPHFV